MNLRHAHAAIGFRRSIVAIAQFAFDFHVSTCLQGAGPKGLEQIVGADAKGEVVEVDRNRTRMNVSG
jgi:hypothetical protein